MKQVNPYDYQPLPLGADVKSAALKFEMAHGQKPRELLVPRHWRGPLPDGIKTVWVDNINKLYIGPRPK